MKLIVTLFLLKAVGSTADACAQWGPLTLAKRPNGHVIMNDGDQFSEAGSKDDCEALCESTEGCNAVSFREDNGRCWLYKHSTTLIDYSNPEDHGHGKRAGSVCTQLHGMGQVVTESACQGSHTEWDICPMSKDCPMPEVVDCALGNWSGWASCDCTGLQMRQRNIVAHNNELGEPCTGALIETQACTPKCHEDPVDCALADWSDWEGECKAWDAQKEKKRELAQSPLNGGSACAGPLTETVSCGTKPPPPTAIDCEVDKWGNWSACTVTCGEGQQTRSRGIVKFAEDGGKPCDEVLEETISCTEGDCPDTEECIWEEWSAYSACTCTCGGGQKTRYRGIKQAPKHGGDLCSTASKSEISPCNTQSCEGCVDGKWSDWQEWDDCTATCDGGITLRTRTVNTTANFCGTPASGSTTEAKPCNTAECDKHENLPCKFTVWSDWSDCSCTCNGVKRRSRAIASYGTGNGAFCEGGLGEVEPCNIGDSAPPLCHAEVPVNCVMGEWEAWGECSATCGGGQRTRIKEVEGDASGGGTPCASSTSETEGCAMGPCDGPPPIPCKWQEWSEWGACDKCGGQKKRFRHIAQMPENAGAACDQASSESTTECSRDCGESIYCEWQDWGEWSACPAKVCSKYKMQRKRILMATTTEPTLSQAKFETLKLQNNAKQFGHIRDLAISFACGLFTFAIMLAVVRVFKPKPRQ